MEASPGPAKKRASNRKRPKPTACFALLPEQVEQLRDLAEGRQVSQSMLVREALDQYFRQIIQEAVEQHSQTEAPRPAGQAPVELPPRLRMVKAEHTGGD
ncbi:MAG: CopG family transcriptional regulator [Thermomicrobiales bacterium]